MLYLLGNPPFIVEQSKSVSDDFGSAIFFKTRQKFSAAASSRSEATTRRLPSWSMARQKPPIDLHLHSSTCQCHRGELALDDRFFGFGGEYGRKLVHQNLDGLVADVHLDARPRSLTLRSESGYLTYIITTRRTTLARCRNIGTGCSWRKEARPDAAESLPDRALPGSQQLARSLPPWPTSTGAGRATAQSYGAS